MKKLLLSLVLLIILPIQVFAIEIKDTKISGPTEGKTGDKVSFTFEIEFEGLNKDSKVGLVGLNLFFKADQTIFNPTAVSSSFASEVFQEDYQFGVASIVTEDESETCSDDTLFCGSHYKLTIEFQILDFDSSIDRTTIDMEDIILYTVPVGTTPETEDDLNQTKFTTNAHHTINLIKTESPSEVLPSIAEKKETPTVTDIKPSTPKTPTQTTPAPPKKTNNTFLKSLKVKNYELNFDKNKDYYEIYIDDDINTLEIEAETEDSTSSYEIKGADDLKKSNNRITIDVTAENKDKKTYTINVKTKYEYKEKEKEETVKIFKYEIKKKYVKYGIIAIVVIVLLIILQVIIKLIKERLTHRKYYKAVKKLNK